LNLAYFSNQGCIYFNYFLFGSPFLVGMALRCPAEKIIEMFEMLNSKVVTTTSLIKANPTGFTALHALCCNPHFTNPERNIDYFKSGLLWLKEKGIGDCHLPVF